jgi:putative ABC transport system permease protein
MNFFFGIEGKIAVDTMAAAPGRTTATIGALMIGLAFVFSNGTVIKSQKEVLTRTLDRAVNVDYFVTTSDQIRSRVYHFSEQTLARTAELADVRRAEGLRVTSVNFRGDEVALLAQDMEAWITRAPDLLNVGRATEVKDEMARGNGFFVSENFAFRFGLKPGDEITLETPAGALSRKIRGILEYYQSEKGTIFIERETYKKYWNDKSVDYILISLKPNARPRKFKTSLESILSGEQKAFIYSQKEYRIWVTGLIDQFFTLNYIQMVIAILVAALGLINTMIISVTERKREIGVLRAIGGLKKQIRKMILLEAVCISVIGIITGLIMGIFIAYCSIKISVVVLAGFSLPFRFPYLLLLSSIPAVILVALLSAWLPARRASELEIAEAIDYE